MDNLKLHTYKDYSELLSRFLAPLYKYLDTDDSLVILPNEVATNYSIKESRIEAFSRILLGLTLVELEENRINKLLVKIEKGIDSSSSYYWGDIKTGSQTIVELFPILLFCYKYRKTLSQEQRAKISTFFNQINNIEIGKNNWLFFSILTNLFLKKIGLYHSEKNIAECWKDIDHLYLGNGWYSDGNVKQSDYYNAFAFHFYSLLYAFYCPEDKERNSISLARAKDFSKSYIYFFSNSGETVPYGRSLTYKFAQVGFWSIYSNFIEDEECLGTIKGIINRNLRWWLSQNILNNDGLLTNGYAYENPYMLEQYNGTGSPYWAFKAFYCMLNPNSIFFCVEELPFPKLDNSIYIPEAYLSVIRNEGHSFLFINGQHNPWFCGNTAKYEKFCYSSLFGFNVPRSNTSYATLSPDSTLVAHIGETTIVRSKAKVVLNSQEVQVSDWNPLPGLLIRSFVFPSAPSHVRIHYVLSDFHIELRDYGFPIQPNSPYYSQVYSPSTSCTIGIETCAPSSNILHAQTKIPYAKIEFARGRHLFVTQVYGGVHNLQDTKSLKSIKIKRNKLIAFNQTYELPSISYKRRFVKIINDIKHIL